MHSYHRACKPQKNHLQIMGSKHALLGRTDNQPGCVCVEFDSVSNGGGYSRRLCGTRRWMDCDKKEGMGFGSGLMEH